jgi:hypothetical protein
VPQGPRLVRGDQPTLAQRGEETVGHLLE